MIHVKITVTALKAVKSNPYCIVSNKYERTVLILIFFTGGRDKSGKSRNMAKVIHIIVLNILKGNGQMLNLSV